MKKIIWIIVIVILLSIGYYTWQNKPSLPVNIISQTSTTTPETKIFTSANQSITFSYPSQLTVVQKNNIITIHHEVPYSHTSACDMKGDGPTLPTLTDFNITMQNFQGTIASTTAKIDPTIDPKNFSGDVLVLSKGFIDPYNIGPYNGYSVTEGVEGCGFVTYYIPISNSRTLVVQKTLIGELSDIVDTATREKILAIPGVITPDQSSAIFNTIMQSISIR